MADENKKVIDEGLVRTIAEDIEKLFPPKGVGTLLNKTRQLKKRVIALNKKWTQRNKEVFNNPNQVSMVQDKKTGGMRASKTATAYSLLFKSNEFEYKEILSLIIEAEIFIEKVRAFFTGRETTYSFGIRYYGELYEYNLSLLDVLEQAVLGIDSKSQGLKLRISKSKSTLIEAYQALRVVENRTIAQEKKEEDSREITNPELFEAIRNYWLKGKKRIGKTALNEGQMYEAYRYYVEDKKRNGFDPSSRSDTNYLKSIAKRTVKNIVSGRQGGDINDAQVKFHGASFASLSNIQRTLEELEKILQNFINNKDKNQFKAGVKKLFTKKEKDIERIEKNAQKEAKEHVDSVIDSIQGLAFK
jgi:hypothetical protein